MIEGRVKADLTGGEEQPMFHALLLEKQAGEEHPATARIAELPEDFLPTEGRVLLRPLYSNVNYKDGLILAGNSRLVPQYPLIPGIDFAGEVIDGGGSDFKPGEQVILTGWRVGEIWPGGYASLARMKPEWLVRLPRNMQLRQAMILGTAGLTAMLSIAALEGRGLRPDGGPVLVTGAAGGVGALSVLLLAQLGYQVTAVTGRLEQAAWLQQLGAQDIIAREEIDEVIARPLESERWAGCIDVVGGAMLARILGQMAYGGSVAAVGLTGGADLPTRMMPFLLRGVALLGIDSVMQPLAIRQQAWDRLAALTPFEMLERLTEEIGPAELPACGEAIRAGQVRGKKLVRLDSWPG